MSTADLVAFLEARIRDDEEIARVVRRDTDPDESWLCDFDSAPDSMDHEAFVHLSRWSPARALRECDAKRKVIALYRAVPELDRDDPDARFNDGWRQGIAVAMEILALPYRDHPDYRHDWDD